MLADMNGKAVNGHRCRRLRRIRDVRILQARREAASGLRDHALIATLFNSVCRIVAADCGLADLGMARFSYSVRPQFVETRLK
jgi:hypothetical protein